VKGGYAKPRGGVRQVLRGGSARTGGGVCQYPRGGAQAAKEGASNTDEGLIQDRKRTERYVIFINGGKRGFLVSLTSNDLRSILGERLHSVDVAAPTA